MQIKLKIDNFNLSTLDIKKTIGYFCKELFVYNLLLLVTKPRGNGFGVLLYRL